MSLISSLDGMFYMQPYLPKELTRGLVLHFIAVYKMTTNRIS